MYKKEKIRFINKINDEIFLIYSKAYINFITKTLALEFSEKYKAQNIKNATEILNAYRTNFKSFIDYSFQ